jgi:hypothetical protein
MEANRALNSIVSSFLGIAGLNSVLKLGIGDVSANPDSLDLRFRRFLSGGLL